MRFDQPVSNDILKGYQLYGFFDKGAVWSFNNNGQVLLPIASAGAGIRFFLADQWQAGIGLAVPVHAGTTVNDVNGVRAIYCTVKIFTAMSPTKRRCGAFNSHVFAICLGGVWPAYFRYCQRKSFFKKIVRKKCARLVLSNKIMGALSS